MKYWMTLAAAAALAVSAEAGPITTPPSPVFGMGGTVTAVYVFADAGDGSILGLTIPAISPIFCNKTVGGCTASTSGDVKDLGTLSGSLVFELHNYSSGKTYDNVSADANGNYHVKISTNFADYNVGALSSAAAAALSGLSNVTFIGFEDKEKSNGSDWDYNDLIFAFSSTSPNENPGVPEPLTLALVGTGLLGLAGVKYRRRKN